MDSGRLMTHPTSRTPQRAGVWARRALPLIAAFSLAFAFGSGEVQAKDRGKHRGHDDHGYGQGSVRGHDYEGCSYGSHRFKVPKRIHHRAASDFRPYYAGRSYYRPHGHAHIVYAFPVWSGAGYALQPHFYCGERLFRVAYNADVYGHDGDFSGYFAFSGRRFGVAVGF